MKTFKIDEKLASSILQYLASKPYIEVSGLINGLQQLVIIEENDTLKNDTEQAS